MHRPALATALVMLMASSGCAVFGMAAEFPAALNKVPELVVKGRALTPQGGAPKLGHARLFKIESANRMPPLVAEVQLEADGRFELEAAVAGYYELELTAVDHSQLRLPLLIDQEVQLTVWLGTYAPKENPARRLVYRLKGETENRHMLPFQKAADGTWVAEGDFPKGRIQYELVEFFHQHSVNGPQASGFVYDGGGDYWSELEMPGGRGRIVVDPRRLPPAGEVARVEFSRPDSACAELARIGLHAWEAGLRPALLKTQGPDAYWTHRLEKAREALPTARPGPVRQRLLLEVLGAAQLLKKPGLATDEEREQVRRELDAADAVWGLFPEAIEGVISRASDAEALAYLGRAGAWSPSPEVRAYALLAQLKAAYAADVPRARELFQRLKGGYSHSRASSLALAFDPDRALRVGQKLPPLLFPAEGADGKAWKLALHELKGVLTLVDFWGPWCPPCVAEVPALQQLHQKYAGGKRPLRLYSVAVRTDRAALEKFLAQHPMPWSHARTEGWAPLAVVDALGLESVPFKVLLDEEGVVLAATPDLTLEEVRARLEGEEPPGPAPVIPAPAPL